MRLRRSRRWRNLVWQVYKRTYHSRFGQVGPLTGLYLAVYVVVILAIAYLKGGIR